MEFKQIDVFFMITFPIAFPGKIFQVRITKIRFCMKENYFYVLIFFTLNVVYGYD